MISRKAATRSTFTSRRRTRRPTSPAARSPRSKVIARSKVQRETRSPSDLALCHALRTTIPCGRARCRPAGGAGAPPADVRRCIKESEMPEFPECLLIVTAEVDAAVEAEWNRWYDTVHLPDALRCPGVQRGRRYIATGG